ncbi:hypothetical protein Sros01_35600 [Streptomyces roseochromogenus]|nr:hypothetical protein Sros01_35600 [Streptomyces roseochromogenus]
MRPFAWAIDMPSAQPAVADYKPLLDRLAAGQTYRFRLAANPVHYIRAQGPRVPVPDGRPRLPRGLRLPAAPQPSSSTGSAVTTDGTGSPSQRSRHPQGRPP